VGLYLLRQEEDEDEETRAHPPGKTLGGQVGKTPAVAGKKKGGSKN